MTIKKSVFALVIVFSFVLCLFFTESYAATINAQSASYSDVASAVSSASEGDTVIVPAGSATWDASLVITKGITLQGAGIGNTIITNGIAKSTVNDYVIKYNPSSGDPWFELTGFTINANSHGGCVTVWHTAAVAALKNFRIHHNRFINSYSNDSGEAQAAVRIKGQVYGLLDNCEFANNDTEFRPMGDDDNSWNNFPIEPGTVNFFYIEDNTFTRTTDMVIESGEGTRWVFRHNNVNLSTMGSGDCILDAHGDTGNRGNVGHECYENTYTNGYEVKMHDHRGGTFFDFNNTIAAGTSGVRTFIHVREEYVPGNDRLTGSYIWNNRNSNDNRIVAVWESDSYGYIEEDTDWWDDAARDPGGESPSNFNYDVAANRPGTCSDDDCYWETDTRKLYRCDGANNWTLIYTPYTYPHPLSLSGPGAPKNLRTINK